MKLDTFLKLYNVRKNAEEREALVKEHITNTHVSYTDKCDRAELIARSSYYVKEKDENGVEQKRFHQNSAAKYMLYSLTVVDMFTDIDVDFKNSVEFFEKINGEILDYIVLNVNERELNEFRMLLEFACDDLIANEYENHAFFKEQIDRFGKLVSVSIKPLLEDLDIQKIQEVIEKMK